MSLNPLSPIDVQTSFRPYALVGLLVRPKASEGLGTTLPVVGVFDLMRFIGPRIFGFNDIHRPHPGPQENLQIGGVRCAISQIWPKFRKMLGENPADIHL